MDQNNCENTNTRLRGGCAAVEPRLTYGLATASHDPDVAAQSGGATS